MKFSRGSYTHFKEPFKIVNLLISSFGKFLPNDDDVVVIFGIRRDILEIPTNIFTRTDTDKYVLFL